MIDKGMINCEFEDGGRASLRHAVVDVLVLKDDKIMLIKRAVGTLEGGKWGLAGGFIDRDETIVQAAAREVLEETGYQIKELVLLKVRDRPERRGEDRQNIVFIYAGTATEKTGQPDDESDEQRWFDLEALPADTDIAFDQADSIKLYLQYRQQKIDVPILSSN